MKKYDVCGLGNALVDLLFECDDQQFKSLNMEKGGMRLIDSETQVKLLEKLGKPVRKASGGSVANSVALVGQLGGRASLICSVANDAFGEFFYTDLARLGVDVFPEKQLPDSELTGTSLVVVTPDAERSMSTCLAGSGEISVNHLDEKVIADSKWLFLEGYLIANSEKAREAILKAVSCANESGTKVAITLSAAFVVNGFKDFLEYLLPKCDLIFCNELEAAALTGEENPELAFERLRTDFGGCVVTAGPLGAFVNYQSKPGHVETGHVAAISCEPVDLTGAGDAFAGAFLHGICTGLGSFESAKKGCFFATEVIKQWGARLRKDAKILHNEFNCL